MDLGKAPEKETIFCHCMDHRRGGEHGTQEAGRESGSMLGMWRNRGDQGIHSLVYTGQGVLPSCLSIPRTGIPEHLTVDGEKAMILTWM